MYRTAVSRSTNLCVYDYTYSKVQIVRKLTNSGIRFSTGLSGKTDRITFYERDESVYDTILDSASRDDAEVTTRT